MSPILSQIAGLSGHGYGELTYVYKAPGSPGYPGDPGDPPTPPPGGPPPGVPGGPNPDQEGSGIQWTTFKTNFKHALYPNIAEFYPIANAVDAGGNMYLVGCVRKGNTGAPAYLFSYGYVVIIKYDVNQEILWEKYIGYEGLTKEESDSDTSSWNIDGISNDVRIQLSPNEGNIYIKLPVYKSKPTGYYSMLLIKMTPNGALVWQKKIELVTETLADLGFDDANNVYLAHWYGETPLWKIGPDGEFIFGKEFSYFPQTYCGKTTTYWGWHRYLSGYHFEPRSIRVTGSSIYVIGGFTEYLNDPSNPSYGTTYWSLGIFCFDLLGDVQWVKRYPDILIDAYTQRTLSNIAFDYPYTNIYVISSTDFGLGYLPWKYSNNQTTQSCFTKINANGDVVWSVGMGTAVPYGTSDVTSYTPIVKWYRANVTPANAYISGTYLSDSSNVTNANGFIMKMGTAGGTSDWQRRLEVDGSVNTYLIPKLAMSKLYDIGYINIEGFETGSYPYFWVNGIVHLDTANPFSGVLTLNIEPIPVEEGNSTFLSNGIVYLTSTPLDLPIVSVTQTVQNLPISTPINETTYNPMAPNAAGSPVAISYVANTIDFSTYYPGNPSYTRNQSFANFFASSPSTVEDTAEVEIYATQDGIRAASVNYLGYFAGPNSPSTQYEIGSGVAYDYVGNLYVGGMYSPNTSVLWGFVSKVSPSGAVLWKKSLSDGNLVNSFIFVRQTAVDSNKNLYAVGNHSGPGAGSYFGFIVKYNDAGVVQWQRRITGDCRTVSIDSFNDVYVAGEYTNDSGGYNGYIVKYDTLGAVQWKKSFSRDVEESNRGASVSGITTDSSNNVYICGAYNPTTGSYDKDGFIAKYDSTGTFLWKRKLRTTTGFEVYDELAGIAVDAYQNVYVCGSFSSNSVLAKYNSTGTLLWKRSFGFSGSATAAFTVTADTLNNIYVAGYYLNNSGGSDAFIIKYDSNGLRIWDRSIYSGPSAALRGAFIYSISVKASTLYISGIFSNNNVSVDGYNALVGKLPTDGSKLGTFVLDSGHSIYISSAGFDEASATSVADSDATTLFQEGGGTSEAAGILTDAPLTITSVIVPI